MTINDFLKQTGEWLKGTGPNSDIVISSRVRLARNLNKIPFSHWANKKETQQILNEVQPAIMDSSYMKGCLFLKIAEMDAIDKQLLLERHLVSKEHITGNDNKAVAISGNEVISIMINEEDHIRLQVIESGFNLQDVWKITSSLDDELSSKLDFAFDPEWGYLTACPTNAGTGMRGSVMCHLPALVLTKQINKLLSAILKIGVAARGFYGEGTEAVGNFFQISNQVTLGHSEEELIDNLERIIKQVIEHETQARENLMTKNAEMLKDRIWRAHGTLKSAYIITSNEAIELLSAVRLGADLGIIKGLDRAFLNDLLITMQPAHLQKIEGKPLSAAERDVKRAKLIKGKLK